MGNVYKEAIQSIGGMQKQISKLKNDIKIDVFEGDALDAYQGVLNGAQKQYDNISNALKSADKQVSKLGKIE